MTQMNETVEEVAKHVLEDVYHGDAKAMEKDFKKYFKKERKRKMKTVKLNSQWGGEYEVAFTLDNYASNDNLYVGLMCFDTEFDAWVPYTDITVNTDTVLNGNKAAVDTNNNGQEIVGWLLKNGFATDDDFEMPVMSGFCVYPVLKFDLDKIKEYLYDGR